MRDLILDFRRGGGSVPEVVYGIVRIWGTAVRPNATSVVVTTETTLKLTDGKATLLNAQTSGTGPLYSWAYIIQVEPFCGRNFRFYVAIPDGTGPVNLVDLPKLNPITGEGFYVSLEEWEALYGGLPSRVDLLETNQGVLQNDVADLKVVAGLAPGDVNDATTANLIETSGTLTGAALSAKYVPESVVDVAFGDGVVDATAHIQSKINSAETFGLETVLPKGRYRLTAPLIFSSGATLRGYPTGVVLDISDVPTGVPALQATGTWGAAVPLSVDAAQAASTITVSSVSGLSAGNRIKVSSTQVFGATSQPRGEIAQIESIAGTTLTLTAPLADSYPVASSGQIEKMNPVRDISITGILIEGPSTDITKDVVGVTIDTAVNVNLDVSTRWCHTGGIYLKDVVGYKVNGHHDDALRPGFGYGIAVLWACQDGIIGPVRGTRLRHLVTVGGGTSRSGIARGLAVSPSIATQMFDSGFDVHPGGEFITFTGCIVWGSDSDGFTSQGGKTSFVNCVAVDVARHGFLTQNLTIRGLDVTMTGCSVTRAGQRGITVIPDTSGTAAYQVWAAFSVVGGSITDTVSHGLSVENSNVTYKIANVNVEGPVITRAGGSGLFLRGTVAANAAATIKGVGPAAEALYLFDSPDASVRAVVDVSTTTRAVRLVSSPDCIISGSRIKNPAGTGVMTDAASTGTLIVGNKITATTRFSLGAGTTEANNA